MGVINKEYEVRGNKELMTDKHGGVGDQNNAVKAGTWAVTRIPLTLFNPGLKVLPPYIFSIKTVQMTIKFKL